MIIVICTILAIVFSIFSIFLSYKNHRNLVKQELELGLRRKDLAERIRLIKEKSNENK